MNTRSQSSRCRLLNHKMFKYIFLFCYVLGVPVIANDDDYIDPASRQLLDFKHEHKDPVGLLTTNAGAPIDIRSTNSLNEQYLLENEYFLDTILGVDNARIPERPVHAKGAGAHGYFELHTDMSKYSKADLFSGPVGKKTPLLCRFSAVVQSLGGNDAERETRGMAIKYYTREGNLDLIGLHIPVYQYRDPVDFISFAGSFKRNAATNLIDQTARFDFVTLRPNALHGLMYLQSDYGIPKGYRKMDAFIQHAMELYNEHGEKFFARINYRTEQGLQNFTSEQAAKIRGRDSDYFIRDLYNAIAKKNYPSWRVEMYIIAEKDIKNLTYDPFDLIRLWEEGTYKVINVGRIVLNRNPKNFFAEVEQAAFNPAHLVPGINGAPDALFKARRLAYRDSIRNRLGINFNKIEVNCPMYAKNYNRDGKPPLKHNMLDAPNYFPNSFNGPQPFVDTSIPYKRTETKASNAVDLGPPAHFYNHILKSEGERQRFIENAADMLAMVVNPVQKRALKLYTLVDADLGKRLVLALEVAKMKARALAAAEAASEKADELAQKLKIDEELKKKQIDSLEEDDSK